MISDIYYFFGFLQYFQRTLFHFFIKWAAKLKTFFDSANFIIYFFQNIFLRTISRFLIGTAKL